MTISSNSHFNLDNNKAYQVWRQHKLNHMAMSLADLIVEINDPMQLTKAEHQAILHRCINNNMAIYVCNKTQEKRQIPLAIGRQFGLHTLDHNWLGDEDGLTSLTQVKQGQHKHYIPYSNRAIQWHTDGYYNSAEKQIYGLILYCDSPASEGGENQLMDHELAYIQLRDKNPDYIKALMENNAMTIPARMNENEVQRPTETGPVFSVSKNNHLHMRYSKRKHNIIWDNNDLLSAAKNYLEALLDQSADNSFQGKLEAGMGLISNNVLHDRASFQDNDQQKRLLYRARYYDRIEERTL